MSRMNLFEYRVEAIIEINEGNAQWLIKTGGYLLRFNN